VRWAVTHFRLTFAGFVLAGAALIFALSKTALRADQEGSAHWGLMGAVLGLMVLFGVVVWARSRSEFANDTDGETFYYLGFIYTLLTLVASFIPLLASGARPLTHQVLGLFGLGLVTTFFGLAGRILFLQGRGSQSVDTNAERLGHAYLEAARQIEATVRGMARVEAELDSVLKRTHQSVAESLLKAMQQIADHSKRLFEDSNRQIADLIRNTAQQVDGTLRGAAENMGLALDSLKSKILELKLPPPQLAEQLEKRLQDLIQVSGAAGHAGEKFQAAVIDAEKGLAQMGPQAASATEAIATITTAIHNAVNGIKESEASIAGLNARLEVLKKVCGESAESVGVLGTNLKAAAIQVDGTEHTFVAFRESMAQLGTTTSSTAPVVGQLGAQAKSSVQQLAELVAAISSVEGLASKITQSQEQTSRVLFRGIELLKEHQERVEALSRLLDADLKLSEDALKKVHKHLIDATQFILSKV